MEDYEKFEKAPDYLMFYIYLNRLIESGAANFSKGNNKIIELSHDASNCFAFGRDENMKPFIAAQEDMLPWFFRLDWAEVNLMFNNKSAYIYLISKAKNGDVNFALGLKVQPKRMVVMYDPKRENINNSVCSLRVVKFGEKRGEIHVSYNSLVAGMKMKLINSTDDIILSNEEEEKYDSGKDPNSMLFVKNKRKI